MRRTLPALLAAGALVAGLLTQRIFLALLAGWLLMGELTRGRQVRPRAPIPPMTFDRPEPPADDEGQEPTTPTTVEVEADPDLGSPPRPEQEPEPER